MIREVIFVNRSKSEETFGLKNWAVISITDPDDQPAKLMDGWMAVHRLSFQDLDPTSSSEKKLRTRVLMTKDQAREIAAFVASVADDVEGILVHCQGGISRSAAVSKWIAEEYRLDFNHSYQLYNKYVYRLLVEAGQCRKERHEPQ